MELYRLIKHYSAKIENKKKSETTVSTVNKWSHYPGYLKHHTQLRFPRELSKWWTFGFYFMVTKKWD